MERLPGKQVLENPGIPLPFRIQTNGLKVVDLEFTVLDEIISRYKPEKNSHLNNQQSSFIKIYFHPALLRNINNTLTSKTKLTPSLTTIQPITVQHQDQEQLHFKYISNWGDMSRARITTIVNNFTVAMDSKSQAASCCLDDRQTEHG
jgi:hypothetical protein